MERERELRPTFLTVRMYSLFDRKRREFGPVFSAKNDEDMRRGLYELRGSGTLPDKYPEDYDVFYLGDYDQATGQLFACEIPSMVVNLEPVLLRPEDRPSVSPLVARS